MVVMEAKTISPGKNQLLSETVNKKKFLTPFERLAPTINTDVLIKTDVENNFIESGVSALVSSFAKKFF